MSWWVSTSDFYAEAARQASLRVNKAERKPKAPGSTWTGGRVSGTPEQDRPESRICALPKCGKKFALNAKGPHRQYCSQRCNAKAWKQRQKEKAA